MNQIVRYAPTVQKYGHNSILFRKRVDLLEKTSPPDGYDFRLADQADLDLIVGHREALSREVYASRLQRGDQCYCLVREDEILSYNWITFSQCCVLCGYERGIEFLPLSMGRVFTYDFYTYSAVRGSGLGSLAKRLMVQSLAMKGIREIYTLVMPHSTASLKIHLRMGYEPVCMVYGYRILGWSRTYYGQPQYKAWLDRWINEFRSVNRIE